MNSQGMASGADGLDSEETWDPRFIGGEGMFGFFVVRIKQVSIIGSFFLGATLAFGSTTLAPKKDGVKVYAEASSKSSVVGELKRDDSVQASERAGMYWKVTYKGQTGFVSVMRVKKVSGGDSSLSHALRSAVKEGRNDDAVSNARTRSTVMGVRGLDENDTSFAGNARPNMRMVYAMEDRKVDAKQLEAFGEEIFAEIEQHMEKR